MPLVFGAIGFVVLGTLYHVISFIIWVHRYSDRLGSESVPMIDDLCDARLARVDLVAVSTGTVVLTLSVVGALSNVAPWLPGAATLVGALVSLLGFVIVTANLLGVIRSHGTQSLVGFACPWIS
ncbi:MAG: hypothetical protein ABEI27_10185 [Halobellus sp.]|uniref:hypothetical protein n=1 Tax=Halobellus sp. TaxID=1979212 RepID=UPI0035D46D38